MTTNSLKDELVTSTKKLVHFANGSKTKAKGIINNDTDYRLMYAKVLKLFEQADKLYVEKKLTKLKKIEKDISKLSVEILDYEKFRMKNP